MEQLDDDQIEQLMLEAEAFDTLEDKDEAVGQPDVAVKTPVFNIVEQFEPVVAVKKKQPPPIPPRKKSPAQS
jgi:hypothetical protein